MITKDPLALVIGRAVDHYAEDTGHDVQIDALLKALEAVRYEVTEAWIRAFPIQNDGKTDV
jgi:hypothetical protein